MTRPYPNAADFAEAERFVAEAYDADLNVCRIWLGNTRPRLVRYAADAAMLARMNAENKAKFQTKRKAA